MIDLRPIGYIVGLMVAVLGALMLIPAMVDWLSGSSDASVFVSCAVMTFSVGSLTALASQNAAGEPL
ncbi:MAG TPA: hypothetical protein VLA50_03030, partial [Erythrobacter sp.]|nr:hypothetical protein [Erythrobacter sp.]